MIEGRYVLRECVGQGGIGSVFLADQVSLGRSVAIKVLQPELINIPGLVRKMHDEAMLACHVRSPHCVEVFDYGVLQDGTPYIVMEYVPGRSLGRVIAEEALPMERALDLFDQILSALAAAHRCGIVHGDVKSDNFLVESVRGADHVTMIDFGLAQVLGTRPDAELGPDELVICGTPEYMAPEVVAGDPPLPASDLYGAGVILYELLTGATPFQGGTAAEIMSRHARDLVIPPSKCRPDRGIPPEIDRIVLEALDKRPCARFASATIFARELREAAGPLRRATSRMVMANERAMPPSHDGHASPPPRRRLARGSDCTSAVRRDTAVLRREIGGALRRGNVIAIADGYLELANVLIEQRKIAQATSELREGIDVLTAGCDPRGSDIPPAVDRLFVALAALYDDAGDPKYARHLAETTDRSPTWTSAIGWLTSSKAGRAHGAGRDHVSNELAGDVRT